MNVHSIFECQPTLFHLIGVQKQNVALIVNAPIAIIISVNGCVVLIVTAKRAQPECLGIICMLVFVETGEDDEVCLTVRSLPDPLARGVSKMKAAGYSDPRVESLENRENRFDLVSNAGIISHQPFPRNNRFIAKRCARHVRNNPRL